MIQTIMASTHKPARGRGRTTRASKPKDPAPEPTTPAIPSIVAQPRAVPSLLPAALGNKLYGLDNIVQMRSTEPNESIIIEGWTKPIVLEPEPESTDTSHKDLTKADIDEFHSVLATVYQCSIDRIDYKFRRISDTSDDDYETHIWLIFYLKEQSEREIFNIKMLLPPELVQMAREIARPNKQ